MTIEDIKQTLSVYLLMRCNLLILYRCSGCVLFKKKKKSIWRVGWLTTTRQRGIVLLNNFSEAEFNSVFPLGSINVIRKFPGNLVSLKDTLCVRRRCRVWRPGNENSGSGLSSEEHEHPQ